MRIGEIILYVENALASTTVNKGDVHIKPALFLIPGTMCDHTLWSAVGPALSEHYELHFLEVPNGNNIEDICMSISSTLPVTGANLIGFSLGGYLAAYIASFSPKLVRQLMIISNSPTQLPQAELKQRAETITWLDKFNYQGMTQHRASQLTSDSCSGFASIFNKMRTMENSVGHSLLKQQLVSTTQRIDLFEQLSKSPFTTRFVFGDEDKLVDNEWIERLESKRVSVSVAEKTGHMLPLESPEFLIKEILNFFPKNQ